MAGTCVKVYYGNFTMLPDAARVLASLHEKDVKFELQEMNKGSNLPPEFFKLQASSRVPGPAFDDGTRVLFDSRATCRYISEKYPNQGNRYLLGRDLLERSLIEQWVKSEEHSFDPPSWTLVFHLAFAPSLHLEPDIAQIQESEKELSEVLDVYEQRLGESKYLAGNEFSLADLTHLPNSHYLANSKDWSYLFTSRKHVNRWWRRISERASWKEASRILDNVPIKQRRDDNNGDTAVTISLHKQQSPKATATLTSQQTISDDATATLESSSQQLQQYTEPTEVAHVKGTLSKHVIVPEPSETTKSASLLQKSDFHPASTFSTQVQSPAISPQEDTTKPSEQAKPSYDIPSPIPLMPMPPTPSSGVPSLPPELVETEPSEPFGSPPTTVQEASLLTSQVDMSKAAAPSSSAPTIKTSGPAPTTPEESVQVHLAKLEPTLPSIAPKSLAAIPTVDGHQVSQPTSAPPSTKKIDQPLTRTPPSDVPSKPSLPSVMERTTRSLQTPPVESLPETKKSDSPLPSQQEVLQPSESPAPSTPPHEMDAPEPPKLSLPSTAKPDDLHKPPQKEFKLLLPSTTNLDALLSSSQPNAPQPSDESLPFPIEIETSLPSQQPETAPKPQASDSPSTTSKEDTLLQPHIVTIPPLSGSLSSSTRETNISSAPSQQPEAPYLPSSTKPETTLSQPSEPSSSSTMQPNPTTVAASKDPVPHESSFPPVSKVDLRSADPKGEPQLPETGTKPQALDSPFTISEVDKSLPSSQEVPLSPGTLSSSTKEANISSAPSQQEVPQSQELSPPSSTKPETSLPSNQSVGPQPSEPSSRSAIQPDPAIIESSKDPFPHKTSLRPTSKVQSPSTDPNGEPQPPDPAPKPQGLDSPSTTLKVAMSLPSHQEDPPSSGSLSFSIKETNISLAIPQPEAPQSQESSSPSSIKPETSLPSTIDRGAPQPSKPSSSSTTQVDPTIVVSSKALAPHESSGPPTLMVDLPLTGPKGEPQSPEMALKPQALDFPSTISEVGTSLPSHQEVPLSSESLSSLKKETNISSVPSQLEAPQSQESSPLSSTKLETPSPSTESKGPQPSKPSPSSTTIPPKPSLSRSISTPISSNTQTKKEDEPSPSFPPNVSESSSHISKLTSNEPNQPSHSDDAMNSTSQIALDRNGKNTDSSISKSSSPSSSSSLTNIPNDAATPTPESNDSPPSKPPRSKPIVPPDLHSPSN